LAALERVVIKIPRDQEYVIAGASAENDAERGVAGQEHIKTSG
jgi:hypothetical protein